jgi:hypothetical protein
MITKKMILGVFCLLLVNALWAGEGSFTQKDRELLIELKVRMMEIDKRFEQVDKRFEQVDKRFEQVDRRFDQSDKQIERMMSFMWMLAGIFATITVSIMSLLFWDRRTMIRPFEKKVAELEIEICENKEINHKLRDVLKEYAKRDHKFAEVIKQFNIF